LPCTTTDFPTTGIYALNLPGPQGANAVGVATTNVGATGTITAEANAGSLGTAVLLAMCQTNPMTGACINPTTPAPSVTLTIGAGEQPTFTVLALANNTTIPQDLAFNRVFVNFHEGSITGPIRGGTSMAVRTFTPGCSP